MPRQKKVKLIGLGLPANVLQDFIQLSYSGQTRSPDGYELDKELSNSRVKVYTKNNSKEAIIVHRGSVGAQDWLDNMSYIARGKVKGTKSYELHKAVQEKAIAKYGADHLTGVGHSRGGIYLATLQKELPPLKEVISYNKGVGFYNMFDTIPENQTDVRTKNDVVSLLSKLQKRKNKMVEIESTKNPLDFNKAHQAEEIEKLGETFIGKKDELSEAEKPMTGSGRAPSPKTLEQLNKMLKTLEKQLININKGKVYKTTNKEKVEYELSYTKARIKNHETKGEDLIITKKAKYGNELPAKAKPYKAKAVKPKKEEPKKEEPKKEEPKKEEPRQNKMRKEEVKPDPSKYKYATILGEVNNPSFPIAIYQNKNFKSWIEWLEKLIEKNKEKNKKIRRTDIFWTPESKQLLNELFEFMTTERGGSVKISILLIDDNFEELLKYLGFDDSYADLLNYEKPLNTKNAKILNEAYKKTYKDIAEQDKALDEEGLTKEEKLKRLDELKEKRDAETYRNKQTEPKKEEPKKKEPKKEEPINEIDTKKLMKLFSTGGAGITQANCKEIVCKYNLYSKDDFKKWVLKNHPDKGGVVPDLIFKAINACVSKNKFCKLKQEPKMNVVELEPEKPKKKEPKKKQLLLSFKEEPKKEEPKKEEPKQEEPKKKNKKEMEEYFRKYPIDYLKKFYNGLVQDEKNRGVKGPFKRAGNLTEDELIEFILKVIIEDQRRKGNIIEGGIFGWSDEEKEAKKAKQEAKRAERQAKYDARKKEQNVKIGELLVSLNALKKKKQAKKEATEAPKTEAEAEPEAEPIEGGIFGWSDKEKADKAERKMLREEYYKTHNSSQNANYTFDKTARKNWKKEFYAKNTFKKADDTMPKAVDTTEQQGIDEAEQEMLGSGMYYLKEISNPTNPIFKYKRTFEIPTFIDPETEFLMGGAFTDMLGMNCNKEDGSCFNPTWERRKIRSQILSEYKIWYNPFAPPAPGTIRMAWLNPMIEERFKPIYDEFVARRNVNVGLPADASRDRFAQQMFSNITDGLSYVPISNIASAGLTLASTLSDTKKEDGT